MSLIDEAEERQHTRSNVAYLLLLATQPAGTIIFVWQELPAFEQLLLNPGEQLPKDIYSGVITFGIFCMMQISYWCRVLYVPIPYRHPSLFLNHIFLFFGRLSFIFGGSLFAVVVFQASSRTGSGFRYRVGDRARYHIHSVLVRIVLHQSRNGAIGSRV